MPINPIQPPSGKGPFEPIAPTGPVAGDNKGFNNQQMMQKLAIMEQTMQLLAMLRKEGKQNIFKPKQD